MRRIPLMLAATLLAGCGGVTSPGGGGHPVGDVLVGNIFFRSAHNGTQNPAVDTIAAFQLQVMLSDRKSTRLNSSHGYISYAVFCLKKKKQQSQLRTHPALQ